MFIRRGQKRAFTLTHLVLLLSAVALIASGVLFTGSYLKMQTPDVPNEFVPVKVTCAVEEVFDGETKKDVCIRNTGDVTGFIRAAVVFNWVREDGAVLSVKPQEGVDYSVLWSDDPAWVLGSDGFWYYTEAVPSGEPTGVLIRSLVCGDTAAEGYQLQVQILATAIQAEPSTVAETVWGVQVNGSKLTPN